MADEERELTREEIEDQDGEPLPPREVMSIVDPGDVGGGLLPLPVDPKESIEWTPPVEPNTSTDET
jgi:hypothetical protein